MEKLLICIEISRENVFTRKDIKKIRDSIIAIPQQGQVVIRQTKLLTEEEIRINEAINHLKKAFKLSSYEMRAYFFMWLRGGPLFVAEIQKLTNIPITRIYDTLKSLERRGWVKVAERRPLVSMPSKTKPLKWEAADLDEKKIKKLTEVRNKIIQIQKRPG